MINVFNSNYEEIGSLDKNLALHTLGKVKIRYGRKYIDLLNDKGELNVSIPKILLEKDSLEDITKDGFYLVDGNLYAYYKGNIYQLTGVEGDYISFAIELNLTQELIDKALNNIGLEFKNITKAKQVIHNGIVFIDDKIFYIDGDDVEELTLREPLSSINNLNMGLPSSDNVAIIYKNGHWEYSDIITLKDLVDLELKIKKDLIIPEKEEEDKNDYEIFDPILYSKVYTIKTAEITSPENDPSNVFLDLLKTIPEFNLQTNDIAILSIPAEKSVQNRLTQINSETTIILGVDTEVIHSDNEVKYEFLEKLDVLTFNLIYKNNKLYFCDKNGNNISLEIGKGKLVAKLEINEVNSDNILDYETVIYIKLLDSLNQPEYWIIKNLALEKRHIYIKAEEPNHLKFKIDYKNAQIALEENTPGDPLSILPHTVLGDLDDADKYYKDPAVSFRTYTEKQSKQGLYSDLPVFSGGEFRGRWPAELTNNELVLNFPRYSKNLNNDLCTNHPASNININNSNDLWRLVIPTIEWIKRNGAMLNRPLKDINEENTTNLPQSPTSLLVLNITPYDFLDTDSIPIAIVYKNGHWTYEPVVPFSWFINCCNAEEPKVYAPVISGTESFTESTTVTITCATEGATIYYTTNGTNPTNSSSRYSSPITLSNTATVKAIAYKDLDVSSVASKLFTKLTGNVYTLKFYYYPNYSSNLLYLNVEFILDIIVTDGTTINLPIPILNFDNYPPQLDLGNKARFSNIGDFYSIDFGNSGCISGYTYTTWSRTGSINDIEFNYWRKIDYAGDASVGIFYSGYYNDSSTDWLSFNWNSFTNWSSLCTIRNDISDSNSMTCLLPDINNKIIRIFATWKKKTTPQITYYNVTYNFDGGTYNYNGEVLSGYVESVVANEKPTWGDNVIPIKSGYTFTGWNPDLSNINTTSTTTAQYLLNQVGNYIIELYMYPAFTGLATIYSVEGISSREIIKENNSTTKKSIYTSQGNNIGSQLPSKSTMNQILRNEIKNGTEYYDGKIRNMLSLPGDLYQHEYSHLLGFSSVMDKVPWNNGNVWPYDNSPHEVIEFKGWINLRDENKDWLGNNDINNITWDEDFYTFTNWNSLPYYSVTVDNNEYRIISLEGIWAPKDLYTVIWDWNLPGENYSNRKEQGTCFKGTHPIWNKSDPTIEGWTFEVWDMTIDYELNEDNKVIHATWSRNI